MASMAQENSTETAATPSATSRRKQTVLAALATAACLFGGLLLGLSAGIVFSNLPMHLPDQTMNMISVTLIICILFVSGAAWGIAIARISSSANLKRMSWAGALSFAPSIILAGLTLASLERIIVERGQGPDLPVHVVFTILFVPAVFFIAGIGGLALGIAQKSLRLGRRLAVGGGLSAALAFLVVDLLMDTLGWRVGAPEAAERATMLTVMMAGNLAAALAGGGTLGYQLSGYFRRITVNLMQ
jgi:hypothetical protein